MSPTDILRRAVAELPVVGTLVESALDLAITLHGEAAARAKLEERIEILAARDAARSEADAKFGARTDTLPPPESM